MIVSFHSWGLTQLIAQESKDTLAVVLNKLSEQDIPTLNTEVNISVNQVRLDEFLRALANDVDLNLSIPTGLDLYVSNNFTKVKAKDVLLFLCREFHLKLTAMGSILKLESNKKKQIGNLAFSVDYKREKDLLSYDLNRVRLRDVTREITRKSGRNIVLAPGLDEQNVSGFVQNMPIHKALQQLTYSNLLQVRKSDELLYIIEHRMNKNSTSGNQRYDEGESQVRSERIQLNLQRGSSVNVFSKDSISVDVDAYPLSTLFQYVAQQLQLKYILLNPLKGNVNIHVKNVTWDDFLYYLFKGGKSIYKCQDGICYVGDRKNLELKSTHLFPMKFRSVSKLKEKLPRDLVRGLEIQEFDELNSLVLQGDADRIKESEKFLKKIDRLVPVVLIDVIIMEVTDTKGLETGIEAGLGEKPVTTKGSVLPGVDMTLGSKSVNNLLDDLKLSKIGKVTPNFYLKLKALETEGKIDLRSTPRLSTLNGHEATLIIGETQYYKEQRNDYFGTQNPQLSSQTTYKPVEAELKVVIKPYVAGDGNVTMEIDVNQSDLTNRISEFAPPGKVTRQFKSMIRIGNQETILLGGLEEKRKSKTVSGVPLLSRIPIIKWFFSSRKQENKKSKLNILIKPTIIG